MDVDAAEVRGEEQRRGVVADQVADRLAAAPGGDGLRLDPVRGVLGQVLLVEGLAADPVGIAQQVRGPLPEVGQQVLRDAVVVADQVALGVAEVGPEDLVQVREPDRAGGLALRALAGESGEQVVSRGVRSALRRNPEAVLARSGRGGTSAKRCVRAPGDRPRQTGGLAGGVELLAAHGDVIAEDDRGALREQRGQQALSLPQRNRAQVPLLVAEEVVQIEDDRDRSVAGEPGRKPLRGGPFGVVRAHECAVSKERLGADRLGRREHLGDPDPGALGPGGRSRARREHPDLAGGTLDEDRCAEEFRLEPERRVGERRGFPGGSDRLRRRLPGPGKGRLDREERLPVRLRPDVAVPALEQQPFVLAAFRPHHVPGAAQLLAPEPDD